MRRFLACFAVMCALAATPALAGEGGGERFVRGAGLDQPSGSATYGATYGPFEVIDARTAALVGITDERSPAQFAALLRDFPQVATLEMVECPGTYDDRANLALGRMIRAEGIATHVPAGGSVRSGAVELFLAGASRSIEDGARFAVHAWLDEEGHEATDFALSAPANRRYLAYYREMGMSPDGAAAFYAMTNSVPHDAARWLSADEMRGWVATEGAVSWPASAEPRLAYLDLGLQLN